MRAIRTLVAVAGISAGFMVSGANAALPPCDAANPTACVPQFGPIPAYAAPLAWIDGGVVKQSLAITACKTIKEPAPKTAPATTGNVTLFNDGSFVLYSDWENAPNTSQIAVTGQWKQILPNKATSKTLSLSINTATMTMLLDDLETVASGKCSNITDLKFLDAANLVKKNTILLKVKNNIATGTLVLAGKEQGKVKGKDKTGNFKMTMAISGQLQNSDALQ